ncbi:Putative exported calcium-binding EF-hand domain protein (plasmid) [Pseudorhizobium banfieldiae]|uniref:Putative exported calcium-binding EF-hand domain protein n=1 Tax=Pseudorhizobium banfieldiae TaxID=1125847 RepID=L0NMD1_9HYPH|nr:hypothetical protein [Pseudorhizobium banfieldiae]CAD6628219.1 hypothetical protein RTCK_03956 [Rhizobium sp. TCK]CAD6628793.1 hypothetical protein RNT25_04213 [arsenite-oxidising bacterium NT-25]CCF22205.1 Putative exported calcium-binding EF-hand domain protein [Pseudorhizobium banfieldiae]
MKTTIARLTASTFALSLLAAPVMAANYSDWDTDGTDGISETEFRAGFEKNEAFDRWDTDSNGSLSEAEFKEGIGDKEQAFSDRYGDGWFDDWDANADAGIDENEYYDGLYSSYDENNNDVIEEPEYGDLGDDMGDDGWFDV